MKLTEDAKLENVQKLVLDEIEKLARKGPTDAEMRKVRNRAEASFLFGLQSNLQRATRLGEMELFYSDARLLNQEPLRYAAVTKVDIQQALKTWLTPERRTLVEARPVSQHRPVSSRN